MNEFYYKDSFDRVYIKQMRDGIVWGWYIYYDRKFRMCATQPKAKLCTELTKDEFEQWMFTEKL